MRKKILLIDDDDQFRKMLRKVLEKEGYAVEEAEDGEKGIHRYRQAPADLVVTDLLMPNMEGIETLRALRASDQKVPVIVVSGGGVGGAGAYLSAARRLGASSTFTKPFDRVQFLEAVAGGLQAGRAGQPEKN